MNASEHGDGRGSDVARGRPAMYDRTVRDEDAMRPPAPPSAKFTYEDLLTFPDDGKRHELIDGDHCVTAAPNLRHQEILLGLATALRNYLANHPAGRVFVAPVDVLLSEFDVVEPDLLYVSRARADILTAQHIRGAPDLVVEIVSSGTRKIDEVVKRKLYERSEVNEYWVVDPELEIIKIYRGSGGAFGRAAELSVEQSDILTTPLLPGLSVPLAEIFASPTQ